MASNPQMDALLKWSVENADESSGGPSAADLVKDIKDGKRSDLDPKVLESLMGKSEAQMMTEELQSALNPSRSEEDRETALDNFEMLIESIDNANLITTMKMWQPLLGLLACDSAKLQIATLWILGTAVQNNPAAQDALLNAPNSLDAILALLRDSPDMGVRAKAMYAISGLLGHHPRAVKEFEQRGGFDALKSALCDPSINLRRKAAFFINALLVQDDSEEQKAAAQPLLIGGPPATSASSTATAAAPSPAAATAPPSRATGLAPAPNSTTPTGPAPYEKPPVTSTAASGVIHPSIPAALVHSGLLQLLVASLLPDNASPATFVQTYHPPALGPNGDAEEARTDEDYAEKALRATATFVAKRGVEVVLEEETKEALKTLKGEMSEGAAGSGSGLWDWKRLNLDGEEWQRFAEGVDHIAA